MTNEAKRMELVRECYKDVLEDISEIYQLELIDGEPSAPHTSEIIRDWRCSAAEEWDEMTAEEADAEFDRLYEIVAEESLQKAMAYA